MVCGEAGKWRLVVVSNSVFKYLRYVPEGPDSPIHRFCRVHVAVVFFIASAAVAVAGTPQDIPISPLALALTQVNEDGASSGEEESVSYTFLGVKISSNEKSGDKWRSPSILMHIRPFGTHRRTNGRDDVRFISGAIVEPYSRIGIGTTLRRGFDLGWRRVPVEWNPPRWWDDASDKKHILKSYFPLEVHFVPYVVQLPYTKDWRVLNRFLLGGVDLYCVYSDWGEMEYATGGSGMRRRYVSLRASYLEIGGQLVWPLVSVQCGWVSYKVMPSTSGEIVLRNMVKDSMVYASIGVTGMGFLALGEKTDSMLGLIPWLRPKK